MSHSKNEENPNLNDKRKSSDNNNGMTQMLELHDKDFKAVIIEIFQQAITNTLVTKIEKASTKK